MSRIPESEIERIKRQTDLAALMCVRGMKLRKHKTTIYFPDFRS